MTHPDTTEGDEGFETMEAICHLADMPTTIEAGTARDHDFDMLILTARVVKKRRGYSVTTKTP